jgi:hypothetical protein
LISLKEFFIFNDTFKVSFFRFHVIARNGIFRILTIASSFFYYNFRSKLTIMKKLFLILSAAFISAFSLAQTRTTITNGNATNPFTWDCTCIPVPGNTIIVNHALTLDTDFAYTSGSVTVNAGGSITGNSAQRIFGVGGGSFTNNGTVDIANIYHSSGTFVNASTMTASNIFGIDATATTQNTGNLTVSDTLLVNTNATLINSGTLYAYVAGVAGVLTNSGTYSGLVYGTTGALNHNSGSFTVTDFANSGTVIANGGMVVNNDFFNSENVDINAQLVIGHSLYNGDTVSMTATFVNDGIISITTDLLNSRTINGTGRFCVGQISSNSGTITGTLDFCDLTGGGVDFNSGTIGSSVTFCAVSCNLDVSQAELQPTISLYPNPFNDQFEIQMSETGEYEIYLVNSLGQSVMHVTMTGQTFVFDGSSFSPGIYYYKVICSEKSIVSSGKLVRE